MESARKHWHVVLFLVLVWADKRASGRQQRAASSDDGNIRLLHPKEGQMFPAGWIEIVWAWRTSEETNQTVAIIVDDRVEAVAEAKEMRSRIRIPPGAHTIGLRAHPHGESGTMSDVCSVEALEVTRAGLKIMEPIPGQVLVNEEIRLIFQESLGSSRFSHLFIFWNNELAHMNNHSCLHVDTCETKTRSIFFPKEMVGEGRHRIKVSLVVWDTWNDDSLPGGLHVEGYEYAVLSACSAGVVHTGSSTCSSWRWCSRQQDERRERAGVAEVLEIELDLFVNMDVDEALWSLAHHPSRRSRGRDDGGAAEACDRGRAVLGGGIGLGSFGGVWEERGWRGARDGSMAPGDAAYVKIVRPRTGHSVRWSKKQLNVEFEIYSDEVHIGDIVFEISNHQRGNRINISPALNACNSSLVYPTCQHGSVTLSLSSIDPQEVSGSSYPLLLSVYVKDGGSAQVGNRALASLRRCLSEICEAEEEEEEEGGAEHALVVYEWPPMADMNGDAERARQIAAALEKEGYKVTVIARECLWMWGEPSETIPPSLRARYSCGHDGQEVSGFLSSRSSFSLAFIVSTYWYHPGRPSLLQMWVPGLRALHPRCKVISMVDVLLARLSVASKESSSSPGDATSCAWRADVPEEEEEESLLASIGHAAGGGAAARQLLELGEADAVGIELPEDVHWIQELYPDLPAFPIRFVRSSWYDESGRWQVGAGGGGEARRRKGILMLGSAHSINVDGVEWFLERVLPLLREESRLTPHDMKVFIVGPDMNHKDSLKAHLTGGGIEIHGRLRGQELEYLMQSCRVFASPIVSGRPSFKTKNLEPLANGMPVVTTSMGALGLHRPPSPGLNTTGVTIVGARAREFADALINLLLSDRDWEEASEAGRRFIERNFLPRHLQEEMRAMIASLNQET